MSKPSELFVRAVNLAFACNGGDYDAAWNTCAQRTHKSIYEEMMNADAARRAEIVNATPAKAPVVRDNSPADLPGDFSRALRSETWADWITTHGGSLKGRQASAVFSVAVERIQRRDALTYDQAWSTARRNFAELYANMSN